MKVHKPRAQFCTVCFYLCHFQAHNKSIHWPLKIIHPLKYINRWIWVLSQNCATVTTPKPGRQSKKLGFCSKGNERPLEGNKQNVFMFYSNLLTTRSFLPLQAPPLIGWASQPVTRWLNFPLAWLAPLSHSLPVNYIRLYSGLIYTVALPAYGPSHMLVSLPGAPFCLLPLLVPRGKSYPLQFWPNAISVLILWGPMIPFCTLRFF